MPLADLAPHPLNPRGSSPRDLTGLAASIAEVGIIQPLTVATREAVVDGSPSLGEQIPPMARWVILAGHGRAEGSALAGLENVPVIVRDDLAPVRITLVIFLAENIHREDLTPLQEARGFDLLRSDGMSQRQIAVEVGVSQSQVSKRLSLLNLPEEIRNGIESGELTASDGMLILDLPSDRQLEAYTLLTEDHRALSAAAAVSSIRARIEDEKRTAEAQTIVAPAGLDPQASDSAMVEDAGSVGDADGQPTNEPATPGQGDGGQSRRVQQSEATANDDGHADAAPSSGHVTEQVGAGGGEDDEYLRSHKEAARRRSNACRALLTASVSSRAHTEIIGDALLLGTPISGSQLSEWLGEVVDQKVVALALNDKKRSRRIALAYALSVLENHASDEKYAGATSWPPVIQRHVSRLVEVVAYEPGPYEARKMA